LEEICIQQPRRVSGSIMKYKIRTLQRKADKEFSRYVKLNQCDNSGYCTCCTCGRTFLWTEIDAGHYVGRACIPLRYDEMNVHPQCKYCNRFREGMKDEYALFLIKTYGEDILNELHQKKYSVGKLTHEDYQELYEMYKEKSNALQGEKEL